MQVCGWRVHGLYVEDLDAFKATALGWTYKTELEDGIRLAYEDFLNNPMRAER